LQRMSSGSRLGGGAVADYATIRLELNPEKPGKVRYHVSKTMPDANALAKYYETLTDAQLLNLRAEDGFTEQAEQVLTEELKRRNFKDSDVKRNTERRNRINPRDEAQEKGFKGRGPSYSLATAASTRPTKRPTSGFEPNGSLWVACQSFH